MTPQELFKAGSLQEAIVTATEEVKRHPTDNSRRGFLCELLCFAGEYQRADVLLDALGNQDPQAVLGVSLFRQVLRAEQARQDFYKQGRMPEFLDLPEPHLKLHLEASILLREGKPKEAAALLDRAEELRPSVSGACDGVAFGDFRDIDDLTAGFFEVLTSTGKYYWIPVERIDQIEFRAAERPRDLLWRRAHAVVRGGPDGEVFFPTLYGGTFAETDDRFRLGRLTDWRGGDGAPMRGVGQRMFVVGDEDRTIMELKELTFEG
ncbi:MAG: SciE type virulence protein [Pirellulales bacterium]|nr:SciE type virulence protein [Pirellulales bacterium]